MPDDASRPQWPPGQAERIGRACLAAAEALAELGGALVGDAVLDKIELDDMPPEERATITAEAASQCSDPPCGPHHEHYVPAGTRRQDDG